MNVFISRFVLGAIAALSLLVPSTNAAQILHYWDFEGGYNDKVDGADGTAGAEVVADTGHDGGTSAFFPGTLSGGGVFNSAGYVDIDSSMTTNSGTNSFSMSYWFRIANDNGTNPRGVFDFSGNGGDGPQSLYIGNTDSLAYRIDGLSGGAAATYNNGGAGFEDGAWHFVVATYTPGLGIELHVDGFGVDATAAGDFGSVIWDADQYLGAFNVSAPATARGLDGSLDDVAIYDGVLSETQIRGLYDGSLQPTDIPEPSTATGALIALLAAFGLRRKLFA